MLATFTLDIYVFRLIAQCAQMFVIIDQYGRDEQLLTYKF